MPFPTAVQSRLQSDDLERLVVPTSDTSKPIIERLEDVGDDTSSFGDPPGPDFEEDASDVESTPIEPPGHLEYQPPSVDGSEGLAVVLPAEETGDVPVGDISEGDASSLDDPPEPNFLIEEDASDAASTPETIQDGLANDEPYAPDGDVLRDTSFARDLLGSRSDVHDLPDITPPADLEHQPPSVDGSDGLTVVLPAEETGDISEDGASSLGDPHGPDFLIEEDASDAASTPETIQDVLAHVEPYVPVHSEEDLRLDVPRWLFSSAHNEPYVQDGDVLHDLPDIEPPGDLESKPESVNDRLGVVVPTSDISESITDTSEDVDDGMSSLGDPHGPDFLVEEDASDASPETSRDGLAHDEPYVQDEKAQSDASQNADLQGLSDILSESLGDSKPPSLDGPEGVRVLPTKEINEVPAVETAKSFDGNDEDGPNGDVINGQLRRHFDWIDMSFEELMATESDYPQLGDDASSFGDPPGPDFLAENPDDVGSLPPSVNGSQVPFEEDADEPLVVQSNTAISADMLRSSTRDGVNEKSDGEANGQISQTDQQIEDGSSFFGLPPGPDSASNHPEDGIMVEQNDDTPSRSEPLLQRFLDDASRTASDDTQRTASESSFGDPPGPDFDPREEDYYSSTGEQVPEHHAPGPDAPQQVMHRSSLEGSESDSAEEYDETVLGSDEPDESEQRDEDDPAAAQVEIESSASSDEDTQRREIPRTVSADAAWEAAAGQPDTRCSVSTVGGADYEDALDHLKDVRRSKPASKLSCQGQDGYVAFAVANSLRQDEMPLEDVMEAVLNKFETPFVISSHTDGQRDDTLVVAYSTHPVDEVWRGAVVSKLRSVASNKDPSVRAIRDLAEAASILASASHREDRVEAESDVGQGSGVTYAVANVLNGDEGAMPLVHDFDAVVGIHDTAMKGGRARPDSCGDPVSLPVDPIESHPRTSTKVGGRSEWITRNDVSTIVTAGALVATLFASVMST